MKQMSSLPLPHRPREKLLKYSADVLTIEELCAVILVTGTRTHSVSKLATIITKATKSELTKTILVRLGVGPSKTAQILAAVELGKRLSQSQQAVTVTTPEHIFALSHEIVSDIKESLLCFYINARGELLKKETVAVGILNQAQLLPREIFQLIKELPVAGIILVHNHPSGNLEPSREDIMFTHRVKEAGEIVGVKLLDHLIVSTKGWYRIKL